MSRAGLDAPRSLVETFAKLPRCRPDDARPRLAGEILITEGFGNPAPTQLAEGPEPRRRGAKSGDPPGREGLS
jgi:hypothetical protein